MPRLKKNEMTTLNVTQEAQRRVFVGLGWDPNDNVGMIDKIKANFSRKPLHHDLDLSCYVFDVNARFIAQVGAQADKHSDQTGKIYHSGDNVEGVGDGDDEQISVELKDLDPAIHSIVFVASVNDGHSFGDVNSPEIRIADGYSGHNFMAMDLNDTEGAGQSLFIFARIFRDADDVWQLHYIGEYMSGADKTSQIETLKGYLSV
jgi:tellurium resistance protein TerZ